MKWRSTNIWYTVVLLPLLLLMALLGIRLTHARLWIVIAIGVLTLLAVVWIIKKGLHLPRPAREYADLQPIALPLPRDYGVRVCVSPAMDRFGFLVRIAELVSPMVFPKEGPVVAVSPKLLEERGERYMAIAATREIERYRRKTQLKTILHLAVPILLLACALLGIILIAFPLGLLSPFAENFVLPFAATILFVGHLLLWNKCLSLREQALDAVLADLFPLQEVKDYIQATEELERRNEKEKYQPFSERYSKERIAKLEQHRSK